MGVTQAPEMGATVAPGTVASMGVTQQFGATQPIGVTKYGPTAVTQGRHPTTVREVVKDERDDGTIKVDETQLDLLLARPVTTQKDVQSPAKSKTSEKTPRKNEEEDKGKVEKKKIEGKKKSEKPKDSEDNIVADKEVQGPKIRFVWTHMPVTVRFLFNLSFNFIRAF